MHHSSNNLTKMFPVSSGGKKKSTRSGGNPRLKAKGAAALPAIDVSLLCKRFPFSVVEQSNVIKSSAFISVRIM